MNTTLAGSEGRQHDVPSRRTWGFYVLAGYPVVFVTGILAAGLVFLSTSDPSLYTSGLTMGFIVLALSILAVLAYPAYRAEAATIERLGGAPPSLRRFTTIGLGVPIALGLLLELVGIGMSGELNVPGFMAGFAALVIHPFVIAVLSAGYVIRRRGWTG